MENRPTGQDSCAEKTDIPAGAGKSSDSLSMHANVPLWCDCCTCEAEPYWVEAMREADDGTGG